MTTAESRQPPDSFHVQNGHSELPTVEQSVSEAHGLPSLVDRGRDLRIVREQALGQGARAAGEKGHGHARFRWKPGQRHIPDLASLIPALATNCRGRLVEGEI